MYCWRLQFLHTTFFDWTDLIFEEICISVHNNSKTTVVAFDSSVNGAFIGRPEPQIFPYWNARNIMHSLSLPPPFYIETVDRQNYICTLSVPCFDEDGVHEVRLFTGSSMGGAITAKHLAALSFTHHLMKTHHITVVDANYQQLMELKGCQFPAAAYTPAPESGPSFNVAHLEFPAATNIPFIPVPISESLENPFNIPAPFVGPFVDPFDTDSLFSFDHDSGPIQLPINTEIFMDGILSHTQSTLEGLLSMDTQATQTEFSEIDMETMQELCYQIEDYNDHRDSKGIPPVQSSTLITRRVERQNRRLRARVINYKAKIREVQEINNVVVRMTKRFLNSFTKFMTRNSASCSRGKAKNDAVKKGKAVIGDNFVSTKEGSSSSSSKTKEKPNKKKTITKTGDLTLRIS